MWAEVYLHAKNDLPASLPAALSSRIQATDVPSAVAETVWAGEDVSGLQVEFAHRSVTLTFLVFSPDVRTLRAHVESSVGKSDLRQLRRCAEEVAKMLRGFLQYHHNSSKDVKILVYAEENHLQTGERYSWWRRFKESVRDDLLVKIYIPTATFLASVVLGYEVKKAAFNVVAAVIAMLVWSLIASTFVSSGEFTYSEN